MAFVLITTAPSRDAYEQITAEVGTDAPPGCIVHTASEVDGGVRVVDVSIDSGASWAQAELLEDLGPWAWRQWRMTVDLTPGEHEILVRAWDSSAATQPEENATLWNPKGYVNNARPHVRVRAAAA